MAEPENRVVIYRCSDRPKYVAKSYYQLLAQTNPETPILVIDNSSMRVGQEQNLEAIQQSHRNFSGMRGGAEFPSINKYVDMEERIGGTNAILKGIKIAREDNPNLENVFVTDDDVMVPAAQHGAGEMHYWDNILDEMLAPNRWSVAAHPWSTDFRNEDSLEVRDEVPGYNFDGVGGGCSGFRLEFMDKHPMAQSTMIRGYNEWMVHSAKKQCAYSNRFCMTIQHIDRPEHQFSLRDSEYDDWANEMYWERWPDRRDPNHPGHERPKGAAGVW